MTCYNLNEYNNPVPVRSIRLNGRRISNPPDDLVISNGLGYPKEETPQPEYDQETQYITKGYKLENGVIIEVWTIHDFDPPEPEEPEEEQQEEPQQNEPEPEPQPQPEPETNE